MKRRSAATSARTSRSVERTAEALDMPDRVAQAPVLVEVAAHELERAVVVRVQHGGAGVVDLAPAPVGGERAPERLVLAVVDVVEPQGLQAVTAVGRVDVREEGRVAVARRPGGRRGRGERREELGQLARDHRARVVPGQVGPEHDADRLRDREALAQGGEPPRRRRGVLGQERDHVAARQVGGEVARAPVSELAARDLVDRRARGAGDRDRPVARARVDDDHLVDALARQRAQHLVEVARPVLDGDHGRDPPHGHRFEVRGGRRRRLA